MGPSNEKNASEKRTKRLRHRTSKTFELRVALAERIYVVYLL